MKAGGNCILSKSDLKLSRSVACATAVGRQFQLLMVRGGKEYLYMFFEVAICLYLCSPLVRVSLLFKYVFGSIVTWLLMILYSMVTLFFGSSLTQRLPIQCVQHVCNAPWFFTPVVIVHKTCCSFLHLFYVLNQIFALRIPACGCIFQKMLYLASQSFDFERTVFVGGYSTNESLALNRIHFFYLRLY